MVYGASGAGEALGERQPFDVLLERYAQNRYAVTVLSDHPLYVASLTGVIISTHFLAITGIIGFVNYAYKKDKITLKDLDKQYKILERLMWFGWF
ncbi:Region of a membrane-bound protein predicted to be embedded in the membrane [Methanobacterium congolense]|uniref:Region of a membrane-bound protein predicted to be embedded in the membrane n=1 Tax=Methanobacterium congolense TaxID=118062 RepID=A0A1D3KZE0_9EURY|nr:Region of a membrane-bound protein predicted to be embedded in the membrane [Methanobacterium congolense]